MPSLCPSQSKGQCRANLPDSSRIFSDKEGTTSRSDVGFPTRQDSLPKRPTQREYCLIAGTAKRIVPYLYSTPDTQLIVPRLTPESPEFYPIIPRYRCVTQVTLFSFNGIRFQSLFVSNPFTPPSSLLIKQWMIVVLSRVQTVE